MKIQNKVGSMCTEQIDKLKIKYAEGCEIEFKAGKIGDVDDKGVWTKPLGKPLWSDDDMYRAKLPNGSCLYDHTIIKAEYAKGGYDAELFSCGSWSDRPLHNPQFNSTNCEYRLVKRKPKEVTYDHTQLKLALDAFDDTVILFKQGDTGNWFKTSSCSPSWFKNVQYKVMRKEPYYKYTYIQCGMSFETTEPKLCQPFVNSMKYVSKREVPAPDNVGYNVQCAISSTLVPDTQELSLPCVIQEGDVIYWSPTYVTQPSQTYTVERINFGGLVVDDDYSQWPIHMAEGSTKYSGRITKVVRKNA